MYLTGNIYFAVNNKAPISDSDAEDTTYFIICAIVKIGHSNREWVHFQIERYGPLLCFLLLFNYLSLYHSGQLESYHLIDILCHHMDMWHINIIAG